ncbi:MAG: LAGLIDADG family homing endonuclease [Thaumarchaeota archaeon]|nr:LAGLIDADG family homing endonuclease [Nitrososphaerota archaeon]
MVGVDISYISGFFDGEGAIHVTVAPGSSLLTLRVTMCQKSIEVLRAIRSALMLLGIYSAISKYASGMYTLAIIRIDDVVRFLRSVQSVVKKRQVRAALDYLEGRVTGNSLLRVLEEEHVRHRRKTSPLRILGPRFPLTRTRALEISAIESGEARIAGNRRAFQSRLRRRMLSLPPRFGTNDIQRIIGVSKPRAQVIGILMEREGLVKSHFERVPPRFRKKVFERL